MTSKELARSDSGKDCVRVMAWCRNMWNLQGLDSFPKVP